VVGGEALRLAEARCKQAQDKCCVFRSRITTIVYKYMHIYLCSALRIVVFRRGTFGFLDAHIGICIYTYGLLYQYRFSGMNSNPGWWNWGQTVMVMLAGVGGCEGQEK